MTTYLELKQQIDALQQQANALKAKERNDVITRIKEAVGAYDITASELGFGTTRQPKSRNAPAKKNGVEKPSRKGTARTGREKVVAYADPNGNTWSGRGKRPNWLREALASGAKLEDFKVAA